MIDVRPRVTIDARDAAFAEPLVEVIRQVRRLRPGEVVEVLTSDRLSRLQIPRWAEKAGHRVVAVETLAGCDRFVLEKGS